METGAYLRSGQLFNLCDLCISHDIVVDVDWWIHEHHFLFGWLEVEDRVMTLVPAHQLMRLFVDLQWKRRKS